MGRVGFGSKARLSMGEIKTDCVVALCARKATRTETFFDKQSMESDFGVLDQD